MERHLAGSHFDVLIYGSEKMKLIKYDFERGYMDEVELNKKQILELKDKIDWFLAGEEDKGDDEW